MFRFQAIWRFSYKRKLNKTNTFDIWHTQSTWAISKILLGFIKSTDHRPTDHRPTNPPTTDPKFTDPLTKFYFKDFIIKKIYFAECKHSCGNVKLYFGLFYLTFVFLTNIKSIRRIKICLLFCLLNYVFKQ